MRPEGRIEPMDALPAGTLRDLRERLGARLSTAEAMRDHHAHGEGWHEPRRPAAVAHVENESEVAAVLGICDRDRVPVVPFGAGSSLEGHVVPVAGGLSLDLTRMNRILEIGEADLDCRVQAGVTRKQLEEELRFRGLFFPVDPGADATFGGMAATGASGTTTVRYGAMRDNILGLTVVLADGSVIRTGGRARKSSAGYDLTRLMVGSEGTLGVITELQLRLYGVPEAISAAVCQFDALAGPVDTVIEAIQLGIPVARCELIDEVQMQASIDFAGLDRYEARPTLFLEFHGSDREVEAQAAQVETIATDNGGGAWSWATLPEERSGLWKARHDAHYAAQAAAPGKRGIVTDVCVPISRLTECILATKEDIRRAGLFGPVFGHVGDGNFHSELFCDPEDHDEVERARDVARRMVERAIGMGGTCTGEHGVGLGKRRYLRDERGPAVDVMARIKAALDPHGILNPGKILS